MDCSPSEMLQGQKSYHECVEGRHDINTAGDERQQQLHVIKPVPHVVTPKQNKKNNVLHVKQLSADSGSTRMKYDFSSSPNLRPKSVSSLVSPKASPRSSPGTPTSTRRRKPPPVPAGASIVDTAKVTPFLNYTDSSSSSDDDGELEIKLIQRSKNLNNNSAPNLMFTKPPLTPTSIRAQSTMLRAPGGITSPPPRGPTLNVSPLLEKKSSSLDDATVLRTRVRTPTCIEDCSSLDHKSASKPPRRPPPDPPKPVLPSLPTSRTNTISGHGEFSKRPHVFTKQSSAGSLRLYPDTKRRGSSDLHSNSNAQIPSPPGNNSTRALPPGVLFTPPPSRSQSLKRFGTASSQRKPDRKPVAPLVSNLTAPNKPLPLVPSLTKPLPPLPTSDNDTLSTSIESDYAYISDMPTDVTMTTKTNVGAVKKPLSFDTDEYVSMSNGTSEIDGSGTRKPSQIGYGDDEYMSMTASSLDFSSRTRSSNSENVVAADSALLSEVFKEEGAGLSDEYMPMYPLASQRLNEQLLTSGDYSQIVIEDEYVKMSSVDTTDPSQGSKEPSTKHPTPAVGGCGSTNPPEPLFNYTSMYIDLDMIRASLILSQQDNEAKHPKSRFSTSTELSSDDKNENKNSVEPGNSTVTSPDHVISPVKGPLSQSTTYSHTSSSRTSPQHHATPPSRSKVDPLPDIDESMSGLYASIDSV